MLSKKKELVLVLGLLAAAQPAIVHAEDKQDTAAVSKDGTVVAANTDGANALTDVMVTATRRKSKLQETPVAVTAIGGDQVRADELRVVNDITHYVPNFTGQSTEGRERPRWFLRGVGSNDPSTTSLSPVGFYLDDVYINSVFGQGTPLFDLDRVEVLRGPQGTLWGKNTIGGAIDILSKKPDFTPGGYAKLGFGNNNSRIAEAAGGGELLEDRIAGRISIYHEQSDSPIINDATGNKFGGFHDTAVRAQLLVLTSADSDWLLNVHARQYGGGGNPWHGVGVDGGGADDQGYVGSTSPDHVALSAPNSDEINTSGVALTGHQDFANDVTFTSITGFEHVERILFDNDYFSPNELMPSRTAVSSNQWSQEFRLASSPKDRLSWIGGVHLFGENLSSDAESATMPGVMTTAFQKSAFSQSTTSAAVFGSATFKVNDRLDLTAGLRWTYEKKTLDIDGYSASGLNFTNPASWWTQSMAGMSQDLSQNVRNTWRAPTFDLSPVYHLSDDALVYARIARGFRSGGYNTSALTNAAFNTVAPEYLTSYEVGLKSEWLDKSLVLNLSAFHYDYKDMQVFALAPAATGGGVVSTLSNAGQGKADGIEVELRSRATRNLTLFTNIGLLDTKFDQFDFVPTAVGNSFARSPKRTISVGGDYRLPVATGNVTLHGDFNYRSLEYFSATRQTNPLLWQGGYTVANAHLSYAPFSEKWLFSVYVNNAFDKTYKKLALIPSYGATPVLYGDQRTFGLTTTVKF